MVYVLIAEKIPFVLFMILMITSGMNFEFCICHDS